ncbi:hypothetical protein H101_07045, partial [Trichophyton interdigitale H6]
KRSRKKTLADGDDEGARAGCGHAHGAVVGPRVTRNFLQAQEVVDGTSIRRSSIPRVLVLLIISIHNNQTSTHQHNKTTINHRYTIIHSSLYSTATTTTNNLIISTSTNTTSTKQNKTNTMASNATDFAIHYASFELPHLKRESMNAFSAASSRFHTPRTSLDNGKRTMPSTPALSRSNSKTRISSPKSSDSKERKAVHAEATYLALR